MQRDHSRRDQVEARMKQQLSDKQKEKVAHYLLHNDSESRLLPQVLELIEKLNTDLNLNE